MVCCPSDGGGGQKEKQAEVVKMRQAAVEELAKIQSDMVDGFPELDVEATLPEGETVAACNGQRPLRCMESRLGLGGMGSRWTSNLKGE